MDKNKIAKVLAYICCTIGIIYLLTGGFFIGFLVGNMIFGGAK
jgi:hypothetical protein